MKLYVYLCTLALVSISQIHSMSTLTRAFKLKPITQTYRPRLIHTKHDNSPNIIQMIIKRDIKGLLTLHATNPTAFHTKSDGLTPLQFAVTCPDSQTQVEILIAAGTPIDAQTKDGDTALHLATQSNNVPAMQALLRNKAATHITNKAGKTALASSKLKIDDLLAD